MTTTILVLKITHDRPDLHTMAGMIAGRAYTIDKVQDCEVVSIDGGQVEELKAAGFSAGEIALGMTEVVR